MKSSLNRDVDNEEVNLLIKDLRKGGFIIDDEVNEASRVKYLANYAAYKGDYLNLIILPTEECNFRCAYCYEGFEKGQMTEEVRSRIKLLVEKRAPYIKRLNVGWFGGEPLLAMDTVKGLSETFLDLKRKFNLVYDSHITTNGSLLDREVFSELLRLGIKRIQVTMDGYGNDHDLRRKFTDGSPSFDLLVKNISEIAKVEGDFRIVIRVNFDHDNVSGIPQLLDLLKSIFKHDERLQLFFRPIGNWGGEIRNEVRQLHLVADNDGAVIQRRLHEEAAKRQIDVRVGLQLPIFETYVCYAGKPNSFVVGSDGTLYKCTVYFEVENNRVGYIDKDGTLKLDVNKLAKWTGYKGDENAKCVKCALLPSCWGAGCPAIGVINGRSPCAATVRGVKQNLQVGYHIAQQQTKGERKCNT
ncbi:MAG: radical SAM protein [Nitrososphaerota archaeon]|nr:radical SAM protein [Nitrososphaerota archaeon]